MKKIKIKLSAILSLLLLFLLVACSTPAPNAGFIKHPERLSKPSTLAFHKAWTKPDVNFRNYDKIIIAPINTQYLLKSEWVLKARNDNKKIKMISNDINDLATYTHRSIIESFKKDPKKRFQVVNYARRTNTLILEMALIEATPSNTTLGALEVIPYPALKVAGKITNDSSIAFEARLRDAGTKEVIATYADRETRDVRIIDTRQLTTFGAVKSVADDWARQFVEIANKAEHEVVKDSFPLKVW